MKPPEVGEGVFRLGTKWLNFYLVVDQDEVTLIDAAAEHGALALEIVRARA
jgi:hypothetical protein